jgi:hypothetical protein
MATHREDESIRKDSKGAVRQREFAEIREAYRERSDSDTTPDDWSNAEEYEA